MKIGILTGSFLPKVGGAQVFSHNISRQLAEFGHDVDVYVPSDQFHALDPRYRSLLTPLPWKFHGAVRSLSSLGMYRAARYLQRRQREKAYDVWLAVGTYVARRLLWLPFILLIVTFITFVLGRYGPGDPVEILMGQHNNPEVVQRV